MQKKTSHGLGTKPKLNGRQITRITGVAAIIAVSVYVALRPLPPDAGDRGSNSAQGPCTAAIETSSSTTDISGCATVGDGARQVEDVAPEKSEENPDNATDSGSAEGHANARRRSNNPADILSSQATGHSSRAGFTLVEICAIADGNMLCRADSPVHSPAHSNFVLDQTSRAGGSISGRVLKEDGGGVPGITVVASPERISGNVRDDAETFRYWTMTDSYGAYTLQGLPEGEFTIRSGRTDEHQSARISARTGVNYADLTIPRITAFVAAGRVVTPLGEPLEGVTVLPMLPGQASKLSDNTGDFYLPLALRERARAFAIRFQRPGFTDTILKIQPTDSSTDLSTLEVVMEPVAAWTAVGGRIESDAGSPLSGETVELRLANGRHSYRTTTKRDGTFDFPGVEAPGDYWLVVNGNDRFKDFEQPLHVHPQLGPVDVVLESYEFGNLTGQLVNSNGVPVPEFELTLRNEASRDPTGLVTTDQSGNFEVAAAPAGSLVISSRSTPHLLVQGVEIKPGETHHVQLTLDWGSHTIQGTVTDTLGLPVPASQIILTWLFESADGISSTATRRTTTDLDGSFLFSNLGPGPHEVRVSAPGFAPVDIEHDLARQGYDINVRLEHKMLTRNAQRQRTLPSVQANTGIAN